MTQYNSVNIRLLNSELNKLRSIIKNDSQVTSNLSSNVTGDSNDDTPFENNSSANIKLSKNQLSKIVQLGRFLDSLLSVPGPSLTCQELQEKFWKI